MPRSLVLRLRLRRPRRLLGDLPRDVLGLTSPQGLEPGPPLRLLLLNLPLPVGAPLLLPLQPDLLVEVLQQLLPLQLCLPPLLLRGPALEVPHGGEEPPGVLLPDILWGGHPGVWIDPPERVVRHLPPLVLPHRVQDLHPLLHARWQVLVLDLPVRLEEVSPRAVLGMRGLSRGGGEPALGRGVLRRLRGGGGVQGTVEPRAPQILRLNGPAEGLLLRLPELVVLERGHVDVVKPFGRRDDAVVVPRSWREARDLRLVEDFPLSLGAPGLHYLLLHHGKLRLLPLQNPHGDLGLLVELLQVLSLLLLLRGGGLLPPALSPPPSPVPVRVLLLLLRLVWANPLLPCPVFRLPRDQHGSAEFRSASLPPSPLTYDDDDDTMHLPLLVVGGSHIGVPGPQCDQDDGLKLQDLAGSGWFPRAQR